MSKIDELLAELDKNQDPPFTEQAARVIRALREGLEKLKDRNECQERHAFRPGYVCDCDHCIAEDALASAETDSLGALTPAAVRAAKGGA